MIDSNVFSAYLQLSVFDDLVHSFLTIDTCITMCTALSAYYLFFMNGITTVHINLVLFLTASPFYCCVRIVQYNYANPG